MSFPLAASSIAASRLAAAERGLITDAPAIEPLARATVVVAGLLSRTVEGMARGELRTLIN